MASAVIKPVINMPIFLSLSNHYHNLLHYIFPKSSPYEINYLQNIGILIAINIESVKF